MLRWRRWWAGLVAGVVAGSTLVAVPAAAETTVMLCPRVVSVEDYSAVEGDPVQILAITKPTRFVFRVTSSGCMQPGAVTYSVDPVEATAGKDFVSTSGTLTFSAGEQRVKTITVDVLMDTVKEADESFCVRVTPSDGLLTKGTSSAEGMILNDDEGPPEEPQDEVLSQLHCSE